MALIAKLELSIEDAAEKNALGVEHLAKLIAAGEPGPARGPARAQHGRRLHETVTKAR